MFYKIINLIKLNSTLKNKIVKTELYKNDFKILKIFMDLNIIKYVKKYKYIKNKKNNIYYIYLNTEVNCNIINLSKPSKPININLKTLSKTNQKKTNITYISTNLGILNTFEAENKKIGGFLIMNILL